VHKVDGRSCQCNFHCQDHKDCCTDVASICANQTDPCIDPKHGCRGRGSGNSTSAAKAQRLPKLANSTKTAKDGKGKPSLSSSKDKDRHTNVHSSSGKPETKSDAKASSADTSSSLATGGKSAGERKKDAGADGKKHEHGMHEHANMHASMNWMVVILACMTGLFVPVTVAIVLVLRSRGVCCPKHPHQRVDAQTKPPETGIQMDPLPTHGVPNSA
jgi:cobalamin biosynthesis Mg chelatase CobN